MTETQIARLLWAGAEWGAGQFGDDIYGCFDPRLDPDRDDFDEFVLAWAKRTWPHLMNNESEPND